MGTKRKERKKKNNTIIIASTISFIILILIIVSVLYKSDVFTSKEGAEQPVVGVPKVQEQEDVNANEQDDTDATNVEPEKQAEPEKEPAFANTEPIVNESGYIEGQKLPTKPTYINGVLIANKKYPLPSNYAPSVVPEAAAALNTMTVAAKVNGFELIAFSSFRSYEYQQQLYTNYVEKDGQVAADRYSARPGYSEHQTGLAFDIGEVGRQNLWLTEEFGETPVGQWLLNNAHEYGFILRYPKGKENITGYMYESWHFRYVGVEIATDVHAENVTLEEYLNIQ